MLLPIILALIVLATLFNLYVYILGKKINRLENKIMKLFEKRNSQMVGIYETTKKSLVKSNEIFEEFFELRRRELFSNNYDTSLEDKIISYQKTHNEINFIFKTCEQHRKIQINPCYIYIREQILDVSKEIGDNMIIHTNINEKYIRLKNITRVMIVGYLY